LLTDHLGTTVGMTDHNGAVLSTQKYWPYGAVRSGSLSQTDKLYTGQQIEPGDSALGLYNYKARFYSTTLGRFVSADTKATDGLNRYSYVGDNPIAAVDPTGLDMLLVCGRSDNCEHGDINAWRNYVEQYWTDKGMFLDYGLDKAFDLLTYTLWATDASRPGLGWNTYQTLAAFGIGFVDSEIGLNYAIQSIGNATAIDPNIDTLLGYSKGGAAIARWLFDVHNGFDELRGVRAVILVEPAFNIGVYDVPPIDANWFPGVTFVTRNEDHCCGRTIVHGTVQNNPNSFYDNPGGCSYVGTVYHCEHKDTAEFDVDVALGLCGSVEDPNHANGTGIMCQDGRSWHR
jgi:RHS repeat-associated protein